MKAIINTKLVMEDGIIWDGALTYEGDIYVIDEDACIECGACADACPVEAPVQE